MDLATRWRTARTRVPLPVRALLFGLLSWLTCVLLPSLHRDGQLSRVALALGLFAPAPLLLGLWLKQRGSELAPYALLTGFPVALAVAVSRFDHDTALATFSPGVLACALASLAGYGAAAIALCSLPEKTRQVDHRPLGEVLPVEPETRRQTVGSVVLAAVTLGGLAALVFGSWASPAHFREQWGRAAPEGATLTALAAGIAGALALSFVGPALRAERSSMPSQEQQRRKLRWLLLVALSGAVVYTVLRLR